MVCSLYFTLLFVFFFFLYFDRTNVKSFCFQGLTALFLWCPFYIPFTVLWILESMWLDPLLNNLDIWVIPILRWVIRSRCFWWNGLVSAIPHFRFIICTRACSSAFWCLKVKSIFWQLWKEHTSIIYMLACWQYYYVHLEYDDHSLFSAVWHIYMLDVFTMIMFCKSSNLLSKWYCLKLCLNLLFLFFGYKLGQFKMVLCSQNYSSCFQTGIVKT